MKAISLMYHDVVPNAANEESGFKGRDADLYKLNIGQFEVHLARIAKYLTHGANIVTEAGTGRTSFFLTFDDGGISAYTQTAAALERLGWRGHFFVTTNYIGTSGFMNVDQIKELDARGHVIGSHSASHPLRMAALSPAELQREWHTSTERLADIVGREITVASVPGGHFSRKVAEAASRAGIMTLFTSEPTSRTYKIDNTLVLGRYTIQRGTSAGNAAAISRGDSFPRVMQFVLWNAKKMVKKIGGESYLKIRKQLLSKI